MSKTFILGSGPVGLITAVFLLEDHDDMTIYMGEKRTEYTRKQILSIQPDVFDLLPKTIKDRLKKKGCAVNNPPRNKGRCWTRTPSGQYSIPVYLLEKIVSEYLQPAVMSGNLIKIQLDGYKRTTPSTIKIPGVGNVKFDYIIGCDGGKSFVAKNTLKARKTHVKHYYGLAVLGDPIDRKQYKKLSKTTHQYSPQNRYRGFASKTGPYYLGVSVDKKTYKKVPKGTTNFEDLDESVQEIINEGLSYYNYDLFDVTVFPILITHSETKPVAGKLKDGNKAFLVGDSTIGSHFFAGQALNTGIRQADFLSTIIKDRNVISQYKSFVKNEYKEKHKNIKSLIIPYEDIEEEYRDFTFTELKEIALENNIRITGLHNKMEIAMVLGNHFVDKL